MSVNAHSPGLGQFLAMDFSAGGGPLTQLVSQRLGAVLAWVGSRLRMSPNQVTGLAWITSVSGSAVYAFTPGTGVASLAWFILLTQLGYALDCADGQLARATQQTSELGKWLDVSLDMVTITSLAFATVYQIVQQQPALLPIAMISGFLYCANRVSNLMTCTLARAVGYSKPGTRKSLLRLIFLACFDTPLVLLSIAVLRAHPSFLCAYLAAISVFFLLHSLYVGTRYNRSHQLPGMPG